MQKKAARRGQRALAFLLCLLMVATLLPVMGASATEGGNAVGKDAPATVSQNPVLDKFLTEDASGNYTLTLTAYATGTTTTVTEKSGKPLDIVLVLDQSGSMYTSNYLQPLKQAVTSFVNNISKNANEYNVDHRIALVGYASNNDDGQSNSGTISSGSSNDSWINTGLFINGTLKNYGSSSKNTNTQLTEQDYKDALVPVNTDGRVTSSITTAISNIAASGATRTSYGMEMANKVFENNPIEGSDRQRIVVVFTDGEPGTSGYSKDEASAAVGKSYIAKNTYGATVYTVGLYSNASTNVTTFMNYLSSNYPKAQSMDNNGVTPVIEYLSVPAAQINNYDKYYYFNNGKYERVYYCDGGWTHDAGWYTQQHGFRTHPGNRIDPSTTQFYVQQTTTPAVATKYYMTTSSSGELDKIFHNISEDIQHPSTDITLNANAELRDQISNVFDVKDGSTITVSTVEGTYNASGEPTWGTETQVSSQPFSGRNISVTGFDYSSNYIADGHPGQKLVVTITNLIPNDGFGDNKMFSNKAGAGIYESVAATTPAAEFPSPWTKVPVYTKVLDFSMTANIATDVQQTNSALAGTYGTFAVGTDASKKLTYSLGTRVSTGNLVFDGVDSVLFYGDYNDDGDDTTARWNKVNVIPANNVYFDDDLLSSSSDFKDNNYGYEANVPATTDTTSVSSGETTFTFKGSRIDVYCTTESASGAVIGQLKAADGTVVATKLMRNEYKSGALYNVPTLSFETPDASATYTLTITTNDQSNYKLDGVRVYHPADETNETVKNAYAADNESNAVFTQVRKLLLTANSFGEGTYSGETISGVVYTDATREDGQTHDTNNVAETYKDLGPKNEVYLANGNGIAFQIPNYNGQKVMIGLSAPETAASGTVTATNGSAAKTIEIESNVDMYYKVTPTSDGYVFIKNTSAALIAVTNVKVSGTGASSASFEVSPQLMSYVEDFDTLSIAEPESPAIPDPTPETPNNTISAIIHAIWSSVRDSIGRLFGRL